MEYAKKERGKGKRLKGRWKHKEAVKHRDLEWLQDVLGHESIDKNGEKGENYVEIWVIQGKEKVKAPHTLIRGEKKRVGGGAQ